MIDYHNIKKLFVVCMSILLFSIHANGHVIGNNDVAFLYDSALIGTESIETDSLYALIYRSIPDTLRLNPIDINEIDEQIVLSLKDATAIIIGETAEWDAESPLSIELCSLAHTNHVLCMNPLFAPNIAFEGFYSDVFFETIQVEERQVRFFQHDYQSIFLDDVLGDNTGHFSIYDSSVIGKFYPASIQSEYLGYIFSIMGSTNMNRTDGFGLSDEGLILFDDSWFLYLGLPHAMISHLTPAGKNLVRNAIHYEIGNDWSIMMRKPHIEGMKINTMGVTADFMAELSSGEANYILPAGHSIFSMYITNIGYGDKPCHWTIDNRFNENHSEIFIEYEGKQDVYRINYLHEEDLAIEPVMEDVKNNQSLLHDLQGRKLQVAKGLSIEGGRVVFRQ